MASRQRRLMTDYIRARLDGPECGFDIRTVKPDDYEHYYILFTPLNGVYKGQKYIIQIDATWDKDQYPLCRPKVKFLNACWHVNVGSSGGICVSFLNESSLWTPSYTFKSILQSIGWLFDEPNPFSPMNGEAGQLWVQCTKEYNRGNPGKLTAAEVEKLYVKCYAPYIEQAAKGCGPTDNYKKWFPQLNPQYYEENIASISIEEKEFKELADQILKKKKPAEPANQPSAQPSTQPSTQPTDPAQTEPSPAHETQGTAEPSPAAESQGAAAACAIIEAAKAGFCEGATPAATQGAPAAKPTRWAKYQVKK